MFRFLPISEHSTTEKHDGPRPATPEPYLLTPFASMEPSERTIGYERRQDESVGGDTCGDVLYEDDESNNSDPYFRESAYARSDGLRHSSGADSCDSILDDGGDLGKNLLHIIERYEEALNKQQQSKELQAEVFAQRGELEKLRHQRQAEFEKLNHQREAERGGESELQRILAVRPNIESKAVEELKKHHDKLLDLVKEKELYIWSLEIQLSEGQEEELAAKQEVSRAKRDYHGYVQRVRRSKEGQVCAIPLDQVTDAVADWGRWKEIPQR